MALKAHKNGTEPHKMLDFIKWLCEKLKIESKRRKKKEKIENMFELFDKTIEMYSNGDDKKCTKEKSS